MRILLVEDDPSLCDAAAYWLRARGYEVDCCKDGEEAAWYMKEGSFDCILLDRMPPPYRRTDAAFTAAGAQGFYPRHSRYRPWFFIRQAFRSGRRGGRLPCKAV